LTAAGTTIAFATVYAAYALYGFLGPGGAFILLGLVALGALLAALVHGPWLAGLGLVGAEITPALVATGKADYWALYLFLIVVTAAAFALARARLWRWLAVTAVVFGVLWGFVGATDAGGASLSAHLAYVVVGFGLAALFLVSGFLLGPDGNDRIEVISSAAIGAYLLPAAWVILGQRYDSPAIVVFTILVLAAIAVGWRAVAALAAVPFAGALSALIRQSSIFMGRSSLRRSWG
jgi:uncharacterized membrane protein